MAAGWRLQVAAATHFVPVFQQACISKVTIRPWHPLHDILRPLPAAAASKHAQCAQERRHGASSCSPSRAPLQPAAAWRWSHTTACRWAGTWLAWCPAWCAVQRNAQRCMLPRSNWSSAAHCHPTTPISLAPSPPPAFNQVLDAASGELRWSVEQRPISIYAYAPALIGGDAVAMKNCLNTLSPSSLCVYTRKPRPAPVPTAAAPAAAPVPAPAAALQEQAQQLAPARRRLQAAQV